jgi:hypothetical protein
VNCLPGPCLFLADGMDVRLRFSVRDISQIQICYMACSWFDASSSNQG